MVNLLSNAHKYTTPGGSIQIVIGIGSDDRVRLDVTDSGIGLSDEDRRRVFRKFFRARLTEAAPGTGLGLALAKALVDRLGGQIWLHSALGAGSTFGVRLPRAAAEQPTTPTDRHTGVESSI